MTSRSDVVVSGIKQMITSGRLPAGSRLPIEKDLAAELGVSRGSLREGVRALAVMGVLDTRQGAGTYVTSLEPNALMGHLGTVVELQSAESGLHLQSVRRVLEGEAAFRAALRIDDDWLGEAEAVLASYDHLISASGEATDHVKFMDVDIAFHNIIAAASGNPVLESLINGLAGRTVRDRLWRAIAEDGAEARTHSEHRAILAALRARDPEAARIRMATHLYAVEEFLHDRLQQQPPPELEGMA